MDVWQTQHKLTGRGSFERHADKKPKAGHLVDLHRKSEALQLLLPLALDDDGIAFGGCRRCVRLQLSPVKVFGVYRCRCLMTVVYVVKSFRVI